MTGMQVGTMMAFALTYSLEAHKLDYSGAGSGGAGQTLALVPALDALLHLESPKNPVYRRPVGYQPPSLRQI